jgi:phosphoglycolate phosphatase-like HAD superfamily hydrolase
LTRCFTRIDGLRAMTGGGHKAEHLVAHLAALGIAGPDTVLIGDSLDDAHAAEAVGAGCVLFAGGFTELGALRESGLPVATTLWDAVKLAAKA